MVLQPGESTFITSTEFMMHEGMDGFHEFRVLLKTNDPANPEIDIRVLSDWVP
ncbi:MAG: hypothetical protein HYZ26_14650 [Chloroflexi bacterium]|nr:hypothetical protein [Chloroflexota bacterium]